MDAGCRVITIQVKIRDDSRGQTRVQLSPAQAQPADKAQNHKDGAVYSQERGRHHGVSPSVSHHPDDAGPYQQGKGQPVVVGDTPHLQSRQDKSHKSIAEVNLSGCFFCFVFCFYFFFFGQLPYFKARPH